MGTTARDGSGAWCPLPSDGWHPPHPHCAPWCGQYCCSHFTEEETEAQRDHATCPKTSLAGGKVGFRAGA